jgi:hypothetical protein
MAQRETLLSSPLWHTAQEEAEASSARSYCLLPLDTPVTPLLLLLWREAEYISLRHRLHLLQRTHLSPSPSLRPRASMVSIRRLPPSLLHSIIDSMHRSITDQSLTALPLLLIMTRTYRDPRRL